MLAVVGGWGLVLFLIFWFIKVPSFDQRQRIEVEGEVVDVTTPICMERPVLDFTLRDQPTLGARVHRGLRAVGRIHYLVRQGATSPATSRA
jgi:hypothetical protein